MSESVENIIIEEHHLFGNGHSMKFFDFLFKTFIFFFAAGTTMELAGLVKTFTVNYKSDLSLFLSIWGNIGTLITFSIIVVINVLIVIAISKNDKQKFSTLVMWRYPIAAIGGAINYMLYVSQYPSLSSVLLPQTIYQVSLQIGIFIPISIYLRKRMNKKVPFDINQDLFN